MHVGVANFSEELCKQPTAHDLQHLSSDQRKSTILKPTAPTCPSTTYLVSKFQIRTVRSAAHVAMRGFREHISSPII